MAEIPPINISLILGPMVVATLVNALLTGICMVQFLEYYDSRIKDRPTIIGLVIWVAVVDTFSSCTFSYLLWYYAVDNFENKIGLLSVPWQSATIPIFTTLISVPVQFFLAWRIRIFSKSFVLFIVICTLSLAQGGLAFASTIDALLEPYVEAYAGRIPVTDSWLAIAVACDASITAALSYYLWKSRAGMKASDKAVISKLIRTSVETALPVTVFCISSLVFLTTMPGSNLSFIFGLPLARLYTNTLLTTLNSRSVLHQQMGRQPWTIPTIGDLFESDLNNLSSCDPHSVQSAAGPSNSFQVDVTATTMMDDLSAGGRKVNRWQSDITNLHGEEEAYWQNSKGNLETLGANTED
ncbi:hypothetical protein D9758_004131 [Tetrapyrgos nigripes]|uniref:DUF6534 domain-containing protein n=1 Tax=Tetrapyrgos nigripes TaxID=182062 RepID=A0A8H5LVS3_9AGAR|nr:hypothetical protein D9758_004131 [Tetrapyrgos nigripes]